MLVESYNIDTFFQFWPVTVVDNIVLDFILTHECFWNFTVIFKDFFIVCDYTYEHSLRLRCWTDLTNNFFHDDVFHCVNTSWSIQDSCHNLSCHHFHCWRVNLNQVQLSRVQSFWLTNLWDDHFVNYTSIVRVFWWFVDWNVHFFALSTVARCFIFVFFMVENCYLTVFCSCFFNFENDLTFFLWRFLTVVDFFFVCCYVIFVVVS